MKRVMAALVAAVALFGMASAGAQEKKVRLSIGTGGTGGAHYPLGGGLAAMISKYVPGVEATAEVTAGSIANLQLIGGGKSELAFTMADAAWDATNGLDKFKDAKVPLRTLVVFYPNRMHVVTVDGTGITKLADLKGKRVSTGSAGSGTEVMAWRVLEAVGIDPKKDIKVERLGVSESVNAIKDRKIDAFFWVGGVPTAAITDLAATPGTKIRLLDHAEALDAMNRKYGPLYAKGIIAPTSYQGMDKPVENVDVWNVLVTNDKMSDQMAYDIVKTLMEKKAELVAVHKEAQNLDLRYQKIGSPIPYHPGAKKYFEEQGIKF